MPDEVDLAVIDVSFISLQLVLEKVKSLIKKSGQIIALAKPQFETEQKAKNKSGVVKTEAEQKEALENSVIVRDMSNRSQETVKLKNLLDYLKDIK